MKKIRTVPVQFLKFLCAFFLVIVLAVIGFNLITHSQRRGKALPISAQLSDQKIEEKDKIRHSEYNEGEMVINLESDSAVMGEDGLHHLIGKVKVTFLRSGVIFSGEEIAHDKEYRHFVAVGPAEITYQDLTLQTSHLDYDVKKDLLQSDRGIIFFSPRISGSAGILKARIYDQSFVLEKNVRVTFSPEDKNEIPLEFYGDSLEYSHKWGSGTLSGEAVLQHGDNRTVAENVEFYLNQDREFITSLTLSGQVSAEMTIVPEGGGSEESSGLISPPQKREIHADEIFVSLHDKTFLARKLEAKGKGRFLMGNAEGGTTEIRSPFIKIMIDAEGKLNNFQAENGIRMEEFLSGNALQRTLTGDSLFYRGKTRVLEIKGVSKKPAALSSAEFRISAPDILHFQNENNLLARGGVSVEFFPAGPDKEALGFFSQEQAIFILADEMRYQDESERFSFQKGVRIWQGNQSLKTEDLVLFKDSGKILCSKKITALFSFLPKSGEEPEMASITADGMSFLPEKSQLVFEGDGKMTIQNVSLSAQSLFVYLEPGAGGLLRIIAREQVQITQDIYRAEGNEAVYELQDETLVLLGDPVLYDKTRGETRGDKLTFYLADDRIVVENLESKRSKTIIKQKS